MNRSIAMLKVLDIVAAVLVIVGALNWGLVGFFDFNLVTALFGTLPVLVKIIYILIGLSAVYQIFHYFKYGTCCNH